MKRISWVAISILTIIFSIWVLLPNIPLIKPSDIVSENFVWWPHLVNFLKGVIPIGLFIFGVFLLWIKSKGLNAEKQKDMLSEDTGEELPDFEDVEYKDLECPECGEDFKTEIGLKVHRKVNHPEEFNE